MVMLEIVTGIPPAVIPPGKPKELQYLMTELLDASAKDKAQHAATFHERLIKKADKAGGFTDAQTNELAQLIYRCAIPRPPDRPRFAQLVEILRELLRTGGKNPNYE